MQPVSCSQLRQVFKNPQVAQALCSYEKNIHDVHFPIQHISNQYIINFEHQHWYFMLLASDTSIVELYVWGNEYPPNEIIQEINAQLMQ